MVKLHLQCSVFRNSFHLCCFSHFKKNIKDKLRSLRFSDCILKERAKLDLLKQQWNTLEHQLSPMCEMLDPEFHY